MSKKFIVSVPTFEKILSNLVELEEVYEQISYDYYSALPEERDKFLDFITEYIRQMDKTLKYVSFSGEEKSKIPFVIIGSEVEIEDVEDNEIFKYQIVSPYQRDVSRDNISFISPLGMALLLKKQGEALEVNTPGGVYRYRVKSIALN